MAAGASLGALLVAIAIVSASITMSHAATTAQRAYEGRVAPTTTAASSNGRGNISPTTLTVNEGDGEGVVSKANSGLPHRRSGADGSEGPEWLQVAARDADVVQPQYPLEIDDAVTIASQPRQARRGHRRQGYCKCRSPHHHCALRWHCTPYSACDTCASLWPLSSPVIPADIHGAHADDDEAWWNDASLMTGVGQEINKGVLSLPWQTRRLFQVQSVQSGGQTVSIADGAVSVTQNSQGGGGGGSFEGKRRTCDCIIHARPHRISKSHPIRDGVIMQLSEIFKSLSTLSIFLYLYNYISTC